MLQMARTRKTFLMTEHLNGLSPVWTLMRCFKWPEREKPFLRTEHLNCLSPVWLQMTRTRKTFLTDRALEWSLSSVNSHVMPEKTLSYNKALKGILSSVKFHVSLQIPRVRKTFLTDTALEGCVTWESTLERDLPRPRKTFRKDRALERFLSSVNSYVILRFHRENKSFLTDGTFVWFISCVMASASNQVTLCWKGFVTKPTLTGSLVRFLQACPCFRILSWSHFFGENEMPQHASPEILEPWLKL